MIPQITTASEIDKVDSMINPDRDKYDSISKRIMQNFKSNLSFAIKEIKDEDNATFRITVLDKKSNPIQGVELIVTDSVTGKSSENQTDEKGEIQFRGLAPHEYKIKVASAPSGHYFKEYKMELENNVVNTKTIFSSAKEELNKKYKVSYKITDQYGVELKDVYVKLKSKDKEYISKTDVYGISSFLLEEPGKYDVIIHKLPESLDYYGKQHINTIKIDDEDGELMYNSAVNIELKDGFDSKLIINVKKGDKPVKKVFISLQDARKEKMYSDYTDDYGRVSFEGLYPGNYVLTVNNEDRLNSNGVGRLHLIDQQCREFTVYLPEKDLKQKSLVVEKKDEDTEKLPDSGSKNERMMILFAVGMIILSYAFNKRK